MADIFPGLPLNILTEITKYAHQLKHLMYLSRYENDYRGNCRLTKTLGQNTIFPHVVALNILTSATNKSHLLTIFTYLSTRHPHRSDSKKCVDTA